MKRYFALFVFAVLLGGAGMATEHLDNSPILLNGDDPKMTGYKDANGLKQGYWIIYGKDMPEKGYPGEGRIEEGEYKNDRKTGEWIVYHTDGETPRLKGNFVDGRPNGPYIKIGPDGNEIEKGSYNNGKQNGSFVTYHDNGAIAQQKTFNAEGKEDGTTTFFHENGQPEFVYTKSNGVLTGEATRYWPDGSVKEIKTYGPGGELLSTVVVNAEPPVAVAVEEGNGGPNGSSGKLKDGKNFACDGYNKVYNGSDELWMDGTFKGCKLWEGKLYKYDSDGILLKFEVWKNGAYHSDGQL